MKDRNPREELFEFGRCVAHFAVDESEVRFCTHLKGKASWFLPFNRGWNDGAGNSPNPSGIRTDYLWRRVLARESLTNILENYAPGGGSEGREDRQEEADAGLAPLPAVRRRAPAARRRRGARGGPPLPDPALGGQRQEQLHRLARPPTHRARKGRRPGLRFDHRHRSGHPRPADRRHDPTIRPGRRDRRARQALRRPAKVHRGGQEDLRRARPAARRRRPAPRLPQIHHEAGDPGGLHPGRAGALHAGGQLLPARQDRGRRPGVRRQEGAEEAAALRRGPRPRDPPEGRDLWSTTSTSRR